jgi:hypothetical protein
MKKILVYVIAIFVLVACTPSQEAIQEAVAQTLTAAPAPVVERPTLALIQLTQPVATTVATAIPISPAPSCSEVHGVELLSEPWHLEGDNGDAQAYQKVEPFVLQGKDTLSVTYNLHGLEIHEGERKDESAIIFDQPNWYVISLANYGENDLDGEQAVNISLSDFISLPDEPSGIPGGEVLNLDKSVNMLHTRFWSSSHFIIDVSSICAFKLQS